MEYEEKTDTKMLSGDSDVLKEAAVYYADAKRKTVADYEALPEGERVELIDGRFYAMAAPTVGHQALLFEIALELRKYVDHKEGECKIYLSPCDVRLDRDEYTMVQPDLMICCKRDRITYKRIEGAPDFVLEIASPGSEYLDYHKKLQKYRAAGVREYWIVNPKTETIMVHYFEKEQEVQTYTFEEREAQTYTFEEQVPVEIYAGDCRIDFAQIREKLEYLKRSKPGKEN